MKSTSDVSPSSLVLASSPQHSSQQMLLAQAVDRFLPRSYRSSELDGIRLVLWKIIVWGGIYLLVSFAGKWNGLSIIDVEIPASIFFYWYIMECFRFKFLNSLSYCKFHWICAIAAILQIPFRKYNCLTFSYSMKNNFFLQFLFDTCFDIHLML